MYRKNYEVDYNYLETKYLKLGIKLTANYRKQKFVCTENQERS